LAPTAGIFAIANMIESGDAEAEQTSDICSTYRRREIISLSRIRRGIVSMSVFHATAASAC